MNLQVVLMRKAFSVFGVKDTAEPVEVYLIIEEMEETPSV